MAKYTSGPWAVMWQNSKKSPPHGWRVPVTVASPSLPNVSSGNVVAIVYGGGDGDKESAEATAKLISAAPDLANAVEALCNIIRDQGALACIFDYEYAPDKFIEENWRDYETPAAVSAWEIGQAALKKAKE